MKPLVTLLCSLLAGYWLLVSARPADDRLQRWQEDLRFLVQELPKRHKNFYAHLKAEDFQKQVEALEAELNQLTDEQISLRFMSLVASAGDSHTNVGAAPFFRQIYPCQLIWLKDGFYAVRTASEHANILGGKWVGIGQHDCDSILKAITPLIAHENEQWLREQLPNYLISAPILTALNLVPSQEPASFRFVMADGTTQEASFTATAAAQVRSWAELLDANKIQLPLRYQDRAKFYWHRFLAEKKAMYVCYRRCASMPKPTINEWAKTLLDDLDQQRPEQLIIDLRDNTGGNSVLFMPILLGIGQRPWLNQPEKIHVLIGRRTFSSGLLNALELKRATKATLVGEPTGQKPNAYGEVKVFTLPHSKLPIQYSTKYFKTMQEDSPSLMPDVLIETTIEDYRQGRDPVLEKVLQR